MDEPCTYHNSPQRGGGPGEVHGRLGVIRCGWLRKQGGFVKTWHSRWFVLRGDRLHYYKDEEETKPLVRQKARQQQRSPRQESGFGIKFPSSVCSDLA